MNPETDDQAAQVPFPRTWMRLVEVVQVEDQVSFRRRVETKIAQVAIAADHRRDARRRQAREVVGHDGRRAA